MTRMGARLRLSVRTVECAPSVLLRQHVRGSTGPLRPPVCGSPLGSLRRLRCAPVRLAVIVSSHCFPPLIGHPFLVRRCTAFVVVQPSRSSIGGPRSCRSTPPHCWFLFAVLSPSHLASSSKPRRIYGSFVRHVCDLRVPSLRGSRVHGATAPSMVSPLRTLRWPRLWHAAIVLERCTGATLRRSVWSRLAVSYTPQLSASARRGQGRGGGCSVGGGVTASSYRLAVRSHRGLAAEAGMPSSVRAPTFRPSHRLRVVAAGFGTLVLRHESNDRAEHPLKGGCPFLLLADVL